MKQEGVYIFQSFLHYSHIELLYCVNKTRPIKHKFVIFIHAVRKVLSKNSTRPYIADRYSYQQNVCFT